MAKFAGLCRRTLNGDGNFAESTAGLAGWKGQDVGGISLAKEFAIQTKQFAIACDQATERSTAGDTIA